MWGSRATRAAAVVLAIADPLAAQHQHAGAPAAPYVEREQHPDGHWSAARGGGESDADLRVTTLMLLAHLGDGSTVRTGANRKQVRLAVWWLEHQQDDRGRFGLRADPDWLLDHAMATYAFAEVVRSAHVAGFAVELRAAVAALRREVEIARPPVGDEVRLWCELVLHSLRVTELDRDMMQLLAAPPRPGRSPVPRRGREAVVDDDPDLGAAALARSLAALQPPPADETPRAAAARFLRAALAGQTPNTDALPACWPQQALDDPLATFFVASAAYLNGGHAFQLAGQQLAQQVVKAQRRDGEHAQTWDPIGEFGRRNGRLGTTAAALLLLEIHYRYCRLELFQ